MYIQYWILGALVVWFALEFGVRKRGIRVVAQLLVMLIVGIAAFNLGALFGRFEPTLEGNNHLKNLTRGLVAITNDEEVDIRVMRERLQDLDRKVIPTYESHIDSREGVTNFLSKYDIAYEVEIPFTSSEAQPE